MCTGQTVDAATEVVLARIERSVKRGLGPCEFKDSFPVESLATCMSQLLSHGTGTLSSTCALLDVVLIACWWLLRGLEVQTARACHCWTEHIADGRKFAFLDRCCIQGFHEARLNCTSALGGRDVLQGL